MAFTDKQQRFIDEYAIDQNQTQAYRRAGYKVQSERAAEAASSRLYAKPHIRAACDERIQALAKKTRLTAEEAWEESRCIAKSDIGDVIDFTGAQPKLKPANQIPESARRAIKSVKVKRYVEGAGDSAREVEVMEFTFWDKPNQLNTTLKAHGELKENLHLSGKIEGDANLSESDKNAILMAMAGKLEAIQAANEGKDESEEADGGGVAGGPEDGAAVGAPGLPPDLGGEGDGS